MALKARLANLDGLSDAIKALYREVDGAFILDVEPTEGWALEDISGLKSTLGKNKTEISQLKTKVQAFGDLDPVAAKEAITKLQEFGGLSADELAKAKVKAALDQQQAQFNLQLAAKDTELKFLTSHIESVMVDQAGTAVLAAKQGNVKLLLPHVKSHLKVVKTDNGFATQVIDAEGNPRISVANGRTSDMTLEELIDEMAASTDYAAAFTATGRPGNGTATDIRPNNTSTRPRQISANDQNAMSASLNDIASGKATVVGLE